MVSVDALKPSYDVVVVGARSAGAATAMLLAREGLSVLAVERSQYGSDTLSTHALMRAGVLQLHRWGVLPRLLAAGTPAVRRTGFHYGDETVEVVIKPRDGVEALYAPRRTVLDARLVDAACEAGAQVLHGARVGALLREGERVAGAVVEDGAGVVRQVRARFVIGADGVTSTVAKLVGAGLTRVGSHACGVVYGYWTGLPTGRYDWYFRPGVSAGMISTNDGASCVFASVPVGRFLSEMRLDREAAHRQVLAETSRELADAVAAATRVGGLRGYAGKPGYMRQSWGPGWALVGDAAHFRDPLTAHGITDALRDAELLARAVTRGTDSALREYQEARDDFAGGLFEASDAIASFAWDLDSAKEHHMFMSREMNREADYLAGLDAKVRTAAASFA